MTQPAVGNEVTLQYHNTLLNIHFHKTLQETFHPLILGYATLVVNSYLPFQNTPIMRT